MASSSTVFDMGLRIFGRLPLRGNRAYLIKAKPYITQSFPWGPNPHNLKVAGSNPASATKSRKNTCKLNELPGFSGCRNRTPIKLSAYDVGSNHAAPIAIWERGRWAQNSLERRLTLLGYIEKPERRPRARRAGSAASLYFASQGAGRGFNHATLRRSRRPAFPSSVGTLRWR
jgi:hypothetical protein